MFTFENHVIQKVYIKCVHGLDGLQKIYLSICDAYIMVYITYQTIERLVYVIYQIIGNLTYIVL